MSPFMIEHAGARDRSELLALLLAAFRASNPQHPPFETLYPDLFPATEAAMGRHLVIREAGCIAACVGSYPMDVRVGDCRISVAGIGQVASAPAQRGGGRMTALMHATVDRLHHEGIALSWLGGRRDRYARFGWELAGTVLRIGMDPRSVGTPPPGWRVESVPTSDPLPEDAWQLHSTSPLHEVTSRELWEARRGRGQTHAWTARRDGARHAEAFAITRRDGNSLHEWTGDPAGLHAIVAAVVAEYGNLSVSCLPGVGPHATMLWSWGQWATGALANLMIVDLAATVAAYAPYLADRVPTGVGLSLAMTWQGQTIGHAQLGDGGESLALDRLAMVRLLFGPGAPSALFALPPRLRWLDQVFPLPFMLPATSYV